MRTLLDRLGNPQEAYPIVHVAGTKGKGSTSAMIATILSKAGYRTGLFTSPHLERVEERIVFEGQQCSEGEFSELIEAIRPVVEELDRAAGEKFEEIGPTYFEILTAMALLHFRRKDATAVVLEVGMGGRLDSTNVCLPKLSIITSISFDHTLQLGNTLKAIAREKGGIIKPGVPVVSGVGEEEPRAEIHRIAGEVGSRVLEIGTDFRYDYAPPRNLELGPHYGIVSFGIAHQSIGCGSEGGVEADESMYPYELSLLGRHQARNAAVALAAISELRRQGWNIPGDAVQSGLIETKLPARVEVIARRPAVILDSAHNTASIGALIEVLKDSFSVRKRHLIFAATKDKDSRAMLQLLLDAFDEVYLTRYTTNPRFVPPDELAAVAFELKGKHFPNFASPMEAWESAVKNATVEDLLCITGSFFVAGELRRRVVAEK